MNNSQIPTKCFISYTHADDRDYREVVRHIKADLGGRFHATTGRPLEIFLDRDSIGWGEDWRASIRESVLEASFFIPVVTMRYFQSAACVEELTTYHENARQLGVPELIRPVILAGSKNLRSESPDKLVQLIEGINHISIETTWLEGYDSPEWNRCIAHMIDELVSALDKVETTLSQRENALETLTVGSEDVEADFQSLTAAIRGATQEMTRTINSMTVLGQVVNGVMDEVNDQGNPSQKQAALARAAGTIGAASKNFAAIASGFENHVTETDVQLRAIVAELREIDSDVARSQLAELLAPLHEYPDLTGETVSIDDTVGALRVLAMSSHSMRRALEPAQRALQSMQVGINTAQSWVAI